MAAPPAGLLAESADWGSGEQEDSRGCGVVGLARAGGRVLPGPHVSTV